ncbi:MAG: hypothetical protein KDC18_16500 [Alphaproteobacteria bacterium]|nr:hypothetical protein [Alphaproteobacteria bacterium]
MGKLVKYLKLNSFFIATLWRVDLAVHPSANFSLRRRRVQNSAPGGVSA